MEKLLGLLKSRKFWAALVGLAVVVGNGVRPEGPILDEQATLAFVLTIASYILGVAVEDNGARKAE